MLAALCASLTIVLAAAPASPERAVKRAAAPAKRSERREHAPTTPKPAKASPRRQGQGDLARARASLADVKRDPAKRRYRHHWEKSIAALERAARGRDTGPALLEAARARYALYRFSQVDSDRTKALALTVRAEKAGATDARALRLAIRHEMGEGPEREPVRPPAARGTVIAKRATQGTTTTPSAPRLIAAPPERGAPEAARVRPQPQ